MLFRSRFDVGATQVAGLEPGGSHQRLLRHFGLPLPDAAPLDPACVVDLADGREPVRIWRDPERWAAERELQFPGSNRFWRLCAALHRANWSFAGRDPVLPPRSLYDLGQLLPALRPANLACGLLATSTTADLLRLTGCGHDPRLRRFLDLQLRLYSQESADRTAPGAARPCGALDVRAERVERERLAHNGEAGQGHRPSIDKPTGDRPRRAPVARLMSTDRRETRCRPGPLRDRSSACSE